MSFQDADRNGAWNILGLPLVAMSTLALTIAPGGAAQNTRARPSPASPERNILSWQPSQHGAPQLKDSTLGGHAALDGFAGRLGEHHSRQSGIPG
jgi:hypothetical protein